MSVSYRRVQVSIERLFGVYTCCRRYLPPGVRPSEDLRCYLPTLQVRTVFDVGANAS